MMWKCENVKMKKAAEDIEPFKLFKPFKLLKHFT